ncbi:MAG: hypothetical protein AAFO69_07085 [Bacteroidota bacterium]
MSIYLREYVNGSGSPGVGEFLPNTLDSYTGGSSFLGLDSIILYKELESGDSIVFRNKDFEDVSTKNHLFDLDDWVEEYPKRFVFTVTETDFQ